MPTRLSLFFPSVVLHSSSILRPPLRPASLSFPKRLHIGPPPRDLITTCSRVSYRPLPASRLIMPVTQLSSLGHPPHSVLSAPSPLSYHSLSLFLSQHLSPPRIPVSVLRHLYLDPSVLYLDPSVSSKPCSPPPPPLLTPQSSHSSSRSARLPSTSSPGCTARPRRSAPGSASCSSSNSSRPLLSSCSSTSS